MNLVSVNWALFLSAAIIQQLEDLHFKRPSFRAAAVCQEDVVRAWLGMGASVLGDGLEETYKHKDWLPGL